MFAVRLANEDNMITGIVYIIMVVYLWLQQEYSIILPDIISHSENHKIIEVLHFVRIKLN